MGENLLVFVALISSHRYLNFSDDLNAAAAFLAFCFCASATYILNDLLDIESDRLHPSKRSRPFASGDFPIPAGIALMLALAAAAAAAAAVLPGDFAPVLAAYAAITVAYSFAFKRVAFVDVAVLACLYYLRVLGGGKAIDCKISFWLSAFSVFLFLGLALLKGASSSPRAPKPPSRADTGARTPKPRAPQEYPPARSRLRCMRSTRRGGRGRTTKIRTRYCWECFR